MMEKKEMKMKRVFGKRPVPLRVFGAEIIILVVSGLIGVFFSFVSVFSGKDAKTSPLDLLAQFMVLAVSIALPFYITIRWFWVFMTIDMKEDDYAKGNNLGFRIGGEVALVGIFSGSTGLYAIGLLTVVYTAFFKAIKLLCKFIVNLFRSIPGFFIRYIYTFKLVGKNTTFRKRCKAVEKELLEKDGVMYPIAPVPDSGMVTAVLLRGDGVARIDTQKRNVWWEYTEVGSEGSRQIIREQVDLQNCKYITVKIGRDVGIVFYDRSRNWKERKVEIHLQYGYFETIASENVYCYPRKDTYEVIMALKSLFDKKVRISVNGKEARKMRDEFTMLLEGDDARMRNGMPEKVVHAG